MHKNDSTMGASHRHGLLPCAAGAALLLVSMGALVAETVQLRFIKAW
ncbi:MAG: hypothetical protein IPP44_24610 [Ideonella sp.]|nr:hypothetical protein [Ideonella sp.]